MRFKKYLIFMFFLKQQKIRFTKMIISHIQIKKLKKY